MEKQKIIRPNDQVLYVTIGDINVRDMAYSPETDDLIWVKEVGEGYLRDQNDVLFYNDSDPHQFYRVVQIGMTLQEFHNQVQALISMQDIQGEIARQTRKAFNSGAIAKSELRPDDFRVARAVLSVIFENLSNSINSDGAAKYRHNLRKII